MLTEIPYERERAVEYARRWALSRNPIFADFTGIGGNCTNFVSQALLAGASVMDFTDTFGWYYRSIESRAPAWSGVDELYDFLTGSGGFEGRGALGPYAQVVTTRDELEIGDVIQLANMRGDFYHSLIVSGLEENDVLVCAQSDNALDRRLSTYNYASLRALHVLGVIIDLPREFCFDTLINGEAINVLMPGVQRILPSRT